MYGDDGAEIGVCAVESASDGWSEGPGAGPAVISGRDCDVSFPCGSTASVVSTASAGCTA